MLWLNQRFPRDWDISYFQATNPYFCGTLWKGSEVSEGTKDSKGPPDWDDIARVLSAHSENLSSLRNLSNLSPLTESYLLIQPLNVITLIFCVFPRETKMPVLENTKGQNRHREISSRFGSVLFAWEITAFPPVPLRLLLTIGSRDLQSYVLMQFRVLLNAW